MPATLRSTLSLALDGQWDQAGLEHPIILPTDRIQAGRRAYERADATFGDSPRTVASRLGVRVIARPGARLCGGEATDGSFIAVTPTVDRRTRGLLIWHGLAHVLLLRERWRHTHADVWLLTMELATPAGVLRSMEREAITEQAHAPTWLTRRWVGIGALLAPPPPLGLQIRRCA